MHDAVTKRSADDYNRRDIRIYEQCSHCECLVRPRRVQIAPASTRKLIVILRIMKNTTCLRTRPTEPNVSSRYIRESVRGRCTIAYVRVFVSVVFLFKFPFHCFKWTRTVVTCPTRIVRTLKKNNNNNNSRPIVVRYNSDLNIYA